MTESLKETWDRRIQEINDEALLPMTPEAIYLHPLLYEMIRDGSFYNEMSLEEPIPPLGISKSIP